MLCWTGGPGGLHTRIFDAYTKHRNDSEVAVLTYTSPDGEEVIQLTYGRRIPPVLIQL